jgi:hypothetical protein
MRGDQKEIKKRVAETVTTSKMNKVAKNVSGAVSQASEVALDRSVLVST